MKPELIKKELNYKMTELPKQEATEAALLKVDGDLREKIANTMRNATTYERGAKEILSLIAPQLQAAEREIERLKEKLAEVTKLWEEAGRNETYLEECVIPEHDMVAEREKQQAVSQAVQQERERIKNWGNETCPHNGFDNRVFKKRECKNCWQALEGKHE